MGLNKKAAGGITYINIRKGVLTVRDKSGNIETYADITGLIYDVKYKMDFYQDKQFEIAQIFMIDEDEKYCLQMRTDSGYFRSLCNCLKSGDIKRPINIRPYIDTKDGKNKATVFVRQSGKVLKHFHTVNNMGDLPSVNKVVFKGKEEWDGTEQLDYFKSWLLQAMGITKDKDEIERPADVSQGEEYADDLPF